MARISESLVVQMVGDDRIVLVNTDSGKEVVLPLSADGIRDLMDHSKSSFVNHPTISGMIPDDLVSTFTFWVGYFYRSAAE